MKEHISYGSPISNIESSYLPKNGGQFLSVGAIAVLVVGCLAAAIGSSSLAVRAIKRYRARRDENRRMSDVVKRALGEEACASGAHHSKSLLHKSMSLSSKSSGESGGETTTVSRSGSGEMMRVAVGRSGTVSPSTSQLDTNLGSVSFAVNYDQQKQVLLVTVIRCNGLPVKDLQQGTTDPYVKLQLLPEKRNRVKTRVLKHTCNPVYEETFTFFGLTQSQVKATSLHFFVLSFDRFSRDDIIGEVLCPLAELDLGMKQEVTKTMDIKPRLFKLDSDNRGELLVSLCHQPAANRLSVVVLKARNLPKMDVTGLASDPYVKIYLLFNGQRIAKKKTHVKKRTLNPVYNESFAFEVPGQEDLRNISMEFHVLDWDRVTKNEMIGRLELGLGKGSEIAEKQWSEIMSNPRKQIAEWHKLLG